ncbi:MAG: zf-HC2 domain-containing protein [Candidatus Tumulicola sp.]
MNQPHPSIDELVDYARSELSARDDAAVHAHLAVCPACAEAHDAEARLVEVLRLHAKAEEREFPPGLAEAIYARAAAERTSAPWWSLRLPALQPAFALAVAAAVAFAVYLSAGGWHGAAKRGSVDAAAYVENHAALASTMPFEETAAIPTMLTSDETENQ